MFIKCRKKFKAHFCYIKFDLSVNISTLGARERESDSVLLISVIRKGTSPCPLSSYTRAMSPNFFQHFPLISP